MNAVATSRATVREISTSISLFVRVIKMHYSSEVRKSSVLSVMGRLLGFVHKVLHLCIHLYIWLNPILRSSFCRLYCINQNTLSLFLRNTLLASFMVTIVPRSSLWTVLLIQPSHGFCQNLKIQKCLLMRMLSLVKAFHTNRLSLLITSLKRRCFTDKTSEDHWALGGTPFPPPSIKQYKSSSGLEQGTCLTRIQNCHSS